MFKNYEEVVAFIEKNSIRMIDFKMLNLRGQWKHLSITPRKFTKDILTSGIGFDGSSYGFLTVEQSDMVFIPDITTAFVDPFAELKTLCMMTNIFALEGDKRVPFKGDPRLIAAKAEEYMRSKEIATRSSFGPEFEFYFFDDVYYSTKPHRFGVEMNNSLAHWNSDNSEINNKGFIKGHHGGYHTDIPQDKNRFIRDEMVTCLEENGVPVKYHHSEVGGAGQMEIEVDFASTLEIADRSMLLKYIVRNKAVENGVSVTFMPKPIYKEAGNGMHVHFHLFNEEDPIFYDEDGYSGLSQTALYAIGGMLKHAPALLALTNPSTNSFKRLVPGYEAPVSICFGTANRSAIIRIPGYATSPMEKRFEFRSSDATANPYFAYSALLMAAIDGIENKIDPQKEGYGPYDVNVFDLPEEERNQIKGLPSNLLEAAQALENDHEFLLAGEVFTKGLIKDIIDQCKMDFKEITQVPTVKEFEKYYDL